jgi:ABC-type bacteriocin/lantibiotic exporter with double-glycine peptidase domain
MAGLCLLLIATGWPGPARSFGEAPESDASDCGAFALYHLLKIEGRATNLQQINSALGVPGVRGHSFRDLRAAAHRFGLSLDALVVAKEPSAMRAPALFFLRSGDDGHFVVVRPVGHTGRMVQVLDGDRAPVVVDAVWLFAWPSWTGLALVPRRANDLAVLAACVSLLSAIALACRTLRRRWLIPH